MGLFRLLGRTTIGLLFVGHGTQKLFGWFGGGGLDGTAGFFEQLGFRPGAATPWPPVPPRPAAVFSSPSALPHHSAPRRSRAR
jgi:uncharacterized membrane protein YphA (DoxX/SURF4 family)